MIKIKPAHFLHHVAYLLDEKQALQERRSVSPNIVKEVLS